VRRPGRDAQLQRTARRGYGVHPVANRCTVKGRPLAADPFARARGPSSRPGGPGTVLTPAARRCRTAGLTQVQASERRGSHQLTVRLGARRVRGRQRRPKSRRGGAAVKLPTAQLLEETALTGRALPN
jgi:hypothetical protein